jgi:hypothetical protein
MGSNLPKFVNCAPGTLPPIRGSSPTRLPNSGQSDPVTAMGPLGVADAPGTATPDPVNYKRRTDMPPSTIMGLPVMNWDRSERRKSAA